MIEPADLQNVVQRDLADRYRVERELGGGGMSRVFLATDESLGRRVVIKVLLPTLAAALSVERFRREVELSAALQHPNVVPVLSAGSLRDGQDGLPYFVMPYIEGESLRARLLRGPLSVRETVIIARDIARGLSFAHGRGVVHRDVKPGNVLLSAGAAVVTDFGIAKAISVSRARGDAAPRGGHVPSAGTLTQIGTSLGTPAYMAPEQAAADPNVDYRADLYALGVVMYEMLIGSPPFSGRTPQALLTAQLSETPPPIAARRYDVPFRLAALVMRCLEKDPARRPKSAAEVLRTLEEADDPSDASAAPAHLRQRRWRSAAAVVLSMVLAAAAALVWTSADRTPAATPAAAPAPVPATPPRALLARSIAVLPLDAVGNDARAAEVAQGLTSELATALARVPGLRVASQSGTAAMRARKTPPLDIARTLGVTLLLEGAVQREGNRLRVTLRLVDAAQETTVWSRTLDGQATEALALQDLASDALVAAFDTPQPAAP